MKHIRWRLLTAMIAMVVVTLALSGLFTRRVTHDEVLRLSARDAASRPKDVIVVDAAGNVISTSPALRGASIHVSGDKVEVAKTRNGSLMRLVLFVRPVPIAGTSNRAYYLPRERPDELASLDRRLVITFAIAILVAAAVTFLISRHITRPIEQLTAAVQEMARGRTPASVAVSGRDEIAQLATSFNAMSDAIATQQELRKRMVGDVAHELRTPVTNLRCELEAVQDGLAPPDIASLYEEVLHLQHLIDDLQDLAVADARGMKLQPEPLDLVAALEQIVKRPVDASSHPIVLADPLRLGQIMRNLLTNAAAYEPVRVAVRSDGRDAIVSVSDSGPGIPPEELENIFERFYRLDPSRARAGGGAGLGLAIVRRLVELHGGHVWAENGPHGGAIITFTIPSHDAATLGA